MLLTSQVRPGTGGEEASLFAMDLWGMYQKFSVLRGWRFETMHLTLTEQGGCKHGSAAISGATSARLRIWLQKHVMSSSTCVRTDLNVEQPVATNRFVVQSWLAAGANVYGTLKWESGTHRVQRVPTTETSGRVHTSAASVIVLAEADQACASPWCMLMLLPRRVRLECIWSPVGPCASERAGPLRVLPSMRLPTAIF